MLSDSNEIYPLQLLLIFFVRWFPNSDVQHDRTVLWTNDLLTCSRVNKLHSQRHGFLLHFHTLVSFKSAFLTFDRESALKKFYSREDENLGKETSLYSINQKCVVEMSSKPRREDSELQRLYPVRFKQVYYFKNALSRSSLQLKSVERAHSFSFYCLRRNTRKLIILVVILVCCFVFHLIS